MSHKRVARRRQGGSLNDTAVLPTINGSYFLLSNESTSNSLITAAPSPPERTTQRETSFRRVPVEVWQEIFAICAEKHQKDLASLQLVCCGWHNVIINDPRLWRNILLDGSYDFGRYKAYIQYIDICIARSRNVGLRVTVWVRKCPDMHVEDNQGAIQDGVGGHESPCVQLARSLTALEGVVRYLVRQLSSNLRDLNIFWWHGHTNSCHCLIENMETIFKVYLLELFSRATALRNVTIEFPFTLLDIIRLPASTRCLVLTDTCWKVGARQGALNSIQTLRIRFSLLRAWRYQATRNGSELWSAFPNLKTLWLMNGDPISQTGEDEPVPLMKPSNSVTTLGICGELPAFIVPTLQFPKLKLLVVVFESGGHSLNDKLEVSSPATHLVCIPKRDDETKYDFVCRLSGILRRNGTRRVYICDCMRCVINDEPAPDPMCDQITTYLADVRLE